ncbi:DNA helicase PIF1, ATP-dependent [Corchorus olitorius]|uniref:DNA helicase PIF1, ATP-dependent n=1 Tax=Corchorus olitorius TaxID=93759 RepID=A0A1R3H8T9_9ROSI|nr:DNA helicase PIF1, ATP-dependent [Corchorus olitorius]
MNGKTILHPAPAPIEMLDLFSGQTVEGRHFRQHIRSYNHNFAFTSMGVHLDQSLPGGNRGVFVFRAQGNIYHKIGGLLPNSNERPRFLQMYVYDTEHETEYRMLENETLDRNLVEKIKNILDKYNPFVKMFRSLSRREDLHSCRLIIKDQPSNQPQYNSPTASQVAAIIDGGQDLAHLNGRQIMVETIAGRLLNVNDTVGYYDPLQYPLLFPCGTYGWDINRHDEFGNKLQCRQFYSYMLQIRPENPSLLLLAGRLLQQYVVDNFVKIEASRLRWLINHQEEIRADCYQGLTDSFIAGENSTSNVGRRTILPSSFVGSPHDMHQRYQDAMALVQKLGLKFNKNFYQVNHLKIVQTCLPEYSIQSLKNLRIDPVARQYLYREFPEHYRWIPSQRKWQRRKSSQKVIGRAAERRGLLENDDSIRQCLLEATTFRMPSALRRLFVILLVYCQASGERRLWEEFYPYMVGDGKKPVINNDMIQVPPLMSVPWEGDQSVDRLIESVFPNLNSHSHDRDYMVQRAILTLRNDEVDRLNEKIIKKNANVAKFEYDVTAEGRNYRRNQKLMPWFHKTSPYERCKNHIKKKFTFGRQKINS